MKFAEQVAFLKTIFPSIGTKVSVAFSFAENKRNDAGDWELTGEIIHGSGEAVYNDMAELNTDGDIDIVHLQFGKNDSKPYRWELVKTMVVRELVSPYAIMAERMSHGDAVAESVEVEETEAVEA